MRLKLGLIIAVTDNASDGSVNLIQQVTWTQVIWIFKVVNDKPIRLSEHFMAAIVYIACTYE